MLRYGPIASRLFALIVTAVLAAGPVPPAALAQNAPVAASSPTFGKRTELPDGSAVMTVGRTLPTPWDTRLGFDASLAPEQQQPDIPALLNNRRSTGAVWGSMTGPSVAPIIYDKTEIGARLDQNDEHGQVAAILSRTVPLGDKLSVTLRDEYAVTQSLGAGETTDPRNGANSAWSIDRSVRLSLGDTGTTFSAGAATSSVDNEWHSRLAAEQKIVGPLWVSTSVTDPGSGASNKSITAGFKRTW